MEDKSLLGRVFDNKVIWQPLYQHPPSLLEAIGEDRQASHSFRVSRLGWRWNWKGPDTRALWCILRRVQRCSSIGVMVAAPEFFVGHGCSQERCGARIPEGSRTSHPAGRKTGTS